MININNELPIFFNSYELELKSKMERLDNLIGKNHWLSVGNYKEKIIRDLLASSLPKRFSLSTGFILSYDENGDKIISKQQDIIIWDSNKYSAIFENDDFVILSPESCSAVIEVKSNLTKTKLHEALESSDSIYPFLRTPFLQIKNIPKFIFAYTSSNSLKTINKNIESFYKNNTNMKWQDRLNQMNSHHKDRTHNMFFFDAIFVLDRGAILKEADFVEGDNKICLTTYNLKNHIYTFFEYKLRGKIDSYNNREGLMYLNNPTYSNFIKYMNISKGEDYIII